MYFDLSAITVRLAPRWADTAAVPATISSGKVRMRYLSVSMSGSHSAPLTMKHSARVSSFA